MEGSLYKIMQTFLHAGGFPTEITRDIPFGISNGIAGGIPEGVHDEVRDGLSV